MFLTRTGSVPRPRAMRSAVGRLLALALVASLCACATRSAPPFEFTADRQGAASLTLGGRPYSLDAVPGTFRPGQRVTVGDATSVLDTGAGQLVIPPVDLSSDSQPTRPLTITTTGGHDDVDPTLTVAALWEPGSPEVEVLPLRQLDDGRLETDVPHFSAVGFITFPSESDLQIWLEATLRATDRYLSDFFNAPYTCPAALFSSSLVDSTGYPYSVNLQVDVSDVDVPQRITKVSICNKLRFVMEYSSTGAGDVSGLALPRSSVALTTPLSGNAGDPFVITAELTPTAVTATLMLVALEVLPGGSSVVEKVLRRGLFSPAAVTLIANSTLACASAVEQARTVPGAETWRTALDCLRDTEEFFEALVQIAADVGVEKAATAAFTGPGAAIVLGGQAVGRLLGEWFRLRPESTVRFPYMLRCAASGICVERPPATRSGTTSPAPDPQIRPTPPPPNPPPATTTPGSTTPRVSTAPATIPPVTSDPRTMTDLRITGVEVRNPGRPGGGYFCGDAVSLVMSIDNPNAQAVDSVVEAIVFQTNGQTAYGDGRQLAISPGQSTESWTFTLPTDWFTYPYDYEFVAYLKPGGYFNSTGLVQSQSPSVPFTMEC